MSDIDRQQPGDLDPGPLPTQGQRPVKRRAFLGEFAPAFYDWANTHEIHGDDKPNAVMENAVGLMLCYDELWFLDRYLCPADMQELDFVKFVSDDERLTNLANEARAEGLRALDRHPGAGKALRPTYIDDNGWPRPSPLPTRDAYIQRNRYRQQAEQLHQLQEHLNDAMSRAGQRVALRMNTQFKHDHDRYDHVWHESLGDRVLQDLRQMSEWWIADALQLGPMDCIANSGSTVLLLDTESGDNSELQFEDHKQAAIEQVLHLRSTEMLGPRGPYHEYIGDLRKDKRIRHLRDFLAGTPSPDGTAEALSREVEQLLTSHQKEALRRDHRPVILRTIGSMSLGFLGNQLLPGLGSVLSTLVNADRMVSDFKFKTDTRWAAFVTDARDELEARKAEGRP